MIEIIVVGGLITWRLANILSVQNGPLDVFARIRAYLASKQKHKGGLYDFVTCTTCISMPIAAVTAILPSQTAFQFIAYTLCFSALGTLLERLTKRV